MIDNKHAHVCDGTVPDRDGDQGPYPPGHPCPVCDSWRQAKRRQALPYLLARRQRDPEQESLEAWE